MAGNDWDQYQRLVLSELKRLSKDVRELVDSNHKIKTEISLLKLRASFWGTMAGMTASLVIGYLKSHLP